MDDSVTDDHDDEARFRAARAGSFGDAADLYERARPSYPADAVDWLIPAGATKIVDLGAGTGKLTRLLADRVSEVIAIDPSEGMLEQLRQEVPDASALVGTAEQMPLADNSVDGVFAAQAWHWVDVPRASVEVARVLRPGGRLGLIWNSRDERVDWVAELTEIIKPPDTHMDFANPEFGEPFGQIEYFVTEWSYPMTASGLLDLVASRSYIIVASEEQRHRALLKVRDLIDHHPALSGRETFDMPYVTYCSRAHC
jgi:SAM-dependent methyltransferase